MPLNQILVNNELLTIHACSCGSVKLWYGNIGIKFDKTGFVHFALHLDNMIENTGSVAQQVMISTGPLQIKLSSSEFSVFNRSVQAASLKLCGWTDLLNPPSTKESKSVTP